MDHTTELTRHAIAQLGTTVIECQTIKESHPQSLPMKMFIAGIKFVIEILYANLLL